MHLWVQVKYVHILYKIIKSSCALDAFTLQKIKIELENSIMALLVCIVIVHAFYNTVYYPVGNEFKQLHKNAFISSHPHASHPMIFFQILQNL